MWYTWGRSEMHTKFESENLKERDYLRDTAIDRRIILKWILKTGSLDVDRMNWLRIGFNVVFS